MTRKAKPKKHTVKEIAAKIDAATTNHGGSLVGVVSLVERWLHHAACVSGWVSLCSDLLPLVGASRSRSNFLLLKILQEVELEIEFGRS